METLFLIKLRKILLSNYPYWSLFIIVLLLSIIRISLPSNLKYQPSQEVQIIGTLTNYHIDGNQLQVTIQTKEKLIGTYYFKTLKEKLTYTKEISLGSKIKAQGTIREPEAPGTKNLFNYKKYLSHQKIYHLLEIEKITSINSSKNLYYILKQKLKNKVQTNPYLQTFILGDKNNLATDVKLSYQNNGISHLFAISGMHINLLATIILKLLAKMKVTEKNRYKITSFLLIAYLVLIGPSASIVRGVLFFILFSINKIYYFYITKINIFLVTLAITLIINPHYLFDVACWYSFSISLCLLLFSKENTTYIKSLWYTSLISFIISIPISLFNFYQLNILSIFYNLFYVPYVSIIVFPLSLLAVIVPYLEPIYNLTTKLLEVTSLYLNQIKLGTLIFPKLSLFIYGLYYVLGMITLQGLKNKKKKYLFLLLFLLLCHALLPSILSKDYLKMIDIGQGDSILLASKNKTVLIDTGGKLKLQEESWKQRKKQTTLTTTTILPLLKSLGIHKIDWLLLSHGDADHAGEALSLLEHIKIKNILINEGKINFLEQQLIKKFPHTHIAKQGTTIQAGNFLLYQLNTDLIDENSSSSIYYVIHPYIKLLFMGDATIKSEEYILKNYQLKNIDVLKVGHHGSTTSSSLTFLKNIQPKLALISAGKDNKFNHPNQEVLTRFDSLSIPFLCTIESGTITIYPKTGKIVADRKT